MKQRLANARSELRLNLLLLRRNAGLLQATIDRMKTSKQKAVQ